MKDFLLLFFCLFAACVYAEEASYGISGNPGAVNSVTGTGELGKRLRIPESSGVRLGGMYIGDCNALLSGRDGTGPWTGNSVLIVDLLIDLQKSVGWKGAYFGSEFLQFNGQPTNADSLIKIFYIRFYVVPSICNLGFLGLKRGRLMCERPEKDEGQRQLGTD